MMTAHQVGHVHSLLVPIRGGELEGVSSIVRVAQLERKIEILIIMWQDMLK
jgi:hypothetical protein